MLKWCATVQAAKKNDSKVMVNLYNECCIVKANHLISCVRDSSHSLG